jgi:hypothetical protein
VSRSAPWEIPGRFVWARKRPLSMTVRVWSEKLKFAFLEYIFILHELWSLKILRSASSNSLITESNIPRVRYVFSPICHINFLTISIIKTLINNKMSFLFNFSKKYLSILNFVLITWMFIYQFSVCIIIYLYSVSIINILIFSSLHWMLTVMFFLHVYTPSYILQLSQLI